MLQCFGDSPPGVLLIFQGGELNLPLDTAYSINYEAIQLLDAPNTELRILLIVSIITSSRVGNSLEG